jgi:hypothetical protein
MRHTIGHAKNLFLMSLISSFYHMYLKLFVEKKPRATPTVTPQGVADSMADTNPSFRASVHRQIGILLRWKNPCWIMSGCGERRLERKKKPERSKRTTERMKKRRNCGRESPD